MGLIKFALRGNYKRYYHDLKELSKINGKNPIIMFFDTGISMILFGSGLQDYLNYKFYEKNYRERKNYATIGYQAKFYKTAANKDYSISLTNKIKFHEDYNMFTRRDYFSNLDTYENFEKFIKKHENFVVKPVTGLAGDSVKKLNKNEIDDKRQFYNELKTKNYLLEELVIQNKKYGKMSPNSINTLRVVTTCVGEKAKIVFVIARFGSGKTIADNFHQGGIAAFVNIKKGIVEGYGIDKKLNKYDKHPASNIKIDQYNIPYWKEIKNMCKEAALVNKKVNIIGWDVAITENGPLLIEGNSGPGFDIVQVISKRGRKDIFRQLKREMKEEKIW